MSVGSQPVPRITLVSHYISYFISSQSRPDVILPTSINNSHINTDRLASSLIDSRSADLATAQRVLVWITACLHRIECVMRHCNYRIVVPRVYATCAQARVVVCKVSSICLGAIWKRKESCPAMTG
jgi:hypothetical protein